MSDVLRVFAGGFLLLMFLAGCLSQSVQPALTAKTIVVRNSSGVDLAAATLAADRTRPGEYVRFGSVSPVLNGMEQVTVRGASAKPLPRYVEFLWVEKDGREYSRNLDLALVVDPTGEVSANGSVLVFDIHPGGGLQVSVRTGP